MTGDRPSSARPDPRERIAWRFFRLVNPLARRMIPAGVPTGAPNILLMCTGAGLVLSARRRSRCSTSMDTRMSRRAMARRAGPETFGRPARRLSSILVVVAVWFTPSRFHPMKRQRFFAACRAVPPVAPSAQIARLREAARRPPTPIPDTHRRHPTGLPRRSSAPPAVRTPTRVTMHRAGTAFRPPQWNPLIARTDSCRTLGQSS